MLRPLPAWSMGRPRRGIPLCETFVNYRWHRWVIFCNLGGDLCDVPSEILMTLLLGIVNCPCVSTGINILVVQLQSCKTYIFMILMHIKQHLFFISTDLLRRRPPPPALHPPLSPRSKLTTTVSAAPGSKSSNLPYSHYKFWGIILPFFSPFRIVKQ